MFGNLVPLLNPIRVAEEYAMLDVMSGGRLIAGFMRGIPHEYVAYNIPPERILGTARGSVRADRQGVDRARALRLGGQALQVSRGVDLAAPDPAAPPADPDVGEQPRIRPLRRAPPGEDGDGDADGSRSREELHPDLQGDRARARLGTRDRRHSRRRTYLRRRGPTRRPGAISAAGSTISTMCCSADPGRRSGW